MLVTRAHPTPTTTNPIPPLAVVAIVVAIVDVVVVDVVEAFYADLANLNNRALEQHCLIVLLIRGIHRDVRVLLMLSI